MNTIYLDSRKDILFIANYWHFEHEKSSSRYRTFADLLVKDFDLEVITSNFCHMKKTHRKTKELNLNELPYQMTLLPEHGYKRNISFKRIYSYIQFGNHVLRYLKKRKKPDAIIVSVPTLTVADKVIKYANKNKIPVILDVQDLWPEAFKMALNIPVLSDVLFAPMMVQENRIYKNADKIVAVSDTYVKRALKYNKKDTSGLSIYIGTDSELVLNKTEGITIEKPEAEFWIGYAGALGHSYDIKVVLNALKIIKDSGITTIKFQVMGTGPLIEEFMRYAKELDVNCNFYGVLDYGVMMKMLMLCDVAVNPIVGRSVASIINKVSDYAAAALPVINTQNSEEYRNLLEKYRAGMNVKNGNATEIAHAIMTLYEDEALKDTMKENAFRLYQDKFDRQKNYVLLTELIHSTINQKNESINQ